MSFFNPLLFFICFFVFVGFLCFARSRKIWLRKITFSAFHFLVFVLMFTVLFFSLDVFVKGIWWQRTKHVTKRNEWRQWWEWSPMSDKEVSCWRVFEHDWRSELVDLNQPRRVPWLMILGLVWQQWCVSCDWVTCVWHRQPAGHTLVNAYHHLPLFFLSLSLSLSTLILLMFTLLPQHVAKSYWKDWATWGGEAEPGGSSGLSKIKRTSC